MPMPSTADRRARIRGAIASELRLPVQLLDDSATVGSLGLDSLGLAQSVVAVEEALSGEVDTERLSGLLAPEMTLGQLLDAIEQSLAAAPAAAGSAA
jgi:acyl carrier protein